jgi:hypothetical protein
MRVSGWTTRISAGDLQAAAEAHAVHRGDHRHGELPPLHRHLLRAVGIAIGALGQARLILGRLAREVRQIESGAERAALAREHHNAQALHPLQCAARLDDALKHLGIERIHLVGPGEADLGDAVLAQLDSDPVVGGHDGG